MKHVSITKPAVSRLDTVLYFSSLLVLALVLWILPPPFYWIGFLLTGMFYIISRYLKPLHLLNSTLEILFLFLLLQNFFRVIGLGNLFILPHFLIIILLYVFLLAIKRIDSQLLFLRIGHTKNLWWIALLMTLLSVAFLILWFLQQPGNPFSFFFPDVSLPLLIFLGFCFAIINSIFEEGIFRSILLSYFREKIGITLAIILQAIWFGLLHYHGGFPSGLDGTGLTIVFGLMMGYLVYRSGGIVLPILIHFLADLAIFFLVLLRMNGIL